MEMKASCVMVLSKYESKCLWFTTLKVNLDRRMKEGIMDPSVIISKRNFQMYLFNSSHPGMDKDLQLPL